MSKKPGREDRVLTLKENLAIIMDDEIRPQFKESEAVKITVLVRCPPFDGTRDVFISDDDPLPILKTIQELIEKGERW